MSKFPNPRAEELYSQQPNDSVGSSSEGVGWAGLYLGGDEEDDFVAEIVVEYSDGSIDYFGFETEGEMRESWVSFEKTFELRTPQPGDPIIYELPKESLLLVSLGISDLDPPALPFGARRFVDTTEAIGWLRDEYDLDGEDVWVWRDDEFYLTDV